jgi:glycosyltransferase involved in cell wall biosynthesis
MSCILYFSRDYSTHDRRFLSALAGTPHQVYYLRLERRQHSLEDRPLPPEIREAPWVGGRKSFHPRDGLRLLNDLRRVIRSVRPDLIHAGPLQTCGLLAALSGFRPLVSMSWGYDLLIDADRDPFNRWATRFTLSHSDVMVGDCKTIRQRAIDFGMPDERIVTFPWGIDLGHFSPEDRRQTTDDRRQQGVESSRQPEADIQGTKLGGQRPAVGGPTTEEIFTILSTRGWEPIYGVELIARAFVSAAKEAQARGLPRLRLLMLGNGSQAALLRQIFSGAGLQDQVYFPGQIGYDRLPHYYRSADLYVSASHSDGTSISLLEAMACGRPVLVSDIPGNREWVRPGEQGWWFPDGDAGALAQGILHAVEERRRLAQMGLAARRTAEQRADWGENFPELLRAYDLAARLE